jgi:hypothetical protein
MDEKEVERLVKVGINGARAAFPDHTAHDSQVAAGVRAVLSAVPSYAQGFEDAKRRAVEKVEALPPKFLAIPPSEHRLAYMDEVIAAIRAIEPQQEGTHEERWAKAGWPFKWSEEHRAYHLRTDKDNDCNAIWCDGWHEIVLPTVQAVDAYIEAHGRRD